MDSASQQVVKENEINASKVPPSHETTENKPSSVQTSIPSTSESPNICQKFTHAVSNRLLSYKVSESDASATETRISSVTLSVDFNDNKSETNLTREPKGIPDYSTIPSEQLNGQFEKSGAQRLIEEKLKEEQPEDGQEISEIDAARYVVH
uniref:Uncharacterized protein n=1 Tax=Acrobeloides nanus TaxID=290746 RepID=A0A914CG48_9BILA